MSFRCLSGQHWSVHFWASRKSVEIPRLEHSPATRGVPLVKLIVEKLWVRPRQGLGLSSFLALEADCRTWRPNLRLRLGGLRSHREAPYRAARPASQSARPPSSRSLRLQML